jgi:CubicO group peptidase (beta-lactamase class C family)
MILVADGDLDLDAPLDEYLPDLAVAGTTLRQLLSHTSGLACDPVVEDVTAATIARYVRDHVRGHHTVLPPGAAFSYSNMGYVLVGHLIETVTGMSWWEAMSSILLRPLGIDPAFVVGGTGAAAGRPIATGHSVNPAADRTRPAGQSLAACEAPAGALAVSAVDLVALGQMHTDGAVRGLLPAPLAAQMRTPVPAADPFGLADGWGLGLALYGGSDGRGDGGGDVRGAGGWVGHDGNAPPATCAPTRPRGR